MVSTGSYIVNATVSSSGVSQITVGDQAVITPSGATTPVYGTVIGLVATTTSGVSAFPVVVNVTGSPTGLFGGTSANVSIIVKELQGVVVVPTGALTYTGGNTAVTLDDAGKRGHAAGHRGHRREGQTEIVSGLNVGQQIYVTTVSFRSPLGTGRTGTGGLGGGTGGFGGGTGGFGGGTGGFGGGTGGFGRRHWRWLRRMTGRHDAGSDPASGGGLAPIDDTGPVWVERTDTVPAVRAVIDVPDVCKIYRSGTLSVAALRGVPSSSSGEYVAIMGPSGQEVHPDAHPGLPGRAHLWPLPPGRGRRELHVRRASCLRRNGGSASSSSSSTSWLTVGLRNVELPLIYAGVAGTSEGTGAEALDGSAWPTGSTTGPASSPAASSNGWRSPGHW